MEIVEGPTLAERLKHGAIPVAELVDIGRQIAEAVGIENSKSLMVTCVSPKPHKNLNVNSIFLIDVEAERDALCERVFAFRNAPAFLAVVADSMPRASA